MNKAVFTQNAANRYSMLTAERQHFVDRGDEAAKLTLPTLFQRDVVAVQNLKIKDPEQSLGTRGVNAMASKMAVSLFPVSAPFYKFNLDEIEEELEDNEELKAQVKSGITRLERQCLTDIENSGDVTTFNEVLKHLLVVGNILAFVEEEATRTFNLNKYVAVRTPAGKWIELIIKEEVMPDSLPEDFVASLEDIAEDKATGHTEKTLLLYTHIKRVGDRVMWQQEVNGKVVPGTEGNVPEEGNPWMPLRFMRVEGEAYGRGHVEMYLGDLRSLETLTKATNDASKAAAKVLFLVKPNGTTNPKVIAQAPNMSVRSGNAEDVTVLRLDKASDMRIAREMIEEISRRLAHAFMIRSEVMRDAERVTAEEVRIVARELDEANGGIYSILSREMQLPYINRRMFLIRRRGAIGKLPSSIRLAIVTGYAALGRADESDRMMRFLEKVNTLLSNPALAQKFNVDKLIERLARSEGVDIEGLLIPAADQAKAQQEGMGQEMMKTMAPELLKQAGPAIMQQLEGQQNVEGNT